MFTAAADSSQQTNNAEAHSNAAVQRSTAMYIGHTMGIDVSSAYTAKQTK
jgi:hypothetical protein